MTGDIAISALPPCPQEWISQLDPEWVALWNNHGRFQRRADEVDVATYHENPLAYSFTYATDEGPAVHKIVDVKIPVTNPDGEITVRVYSPDTDKAVPVHFNMHGGGWVLGGLKSEQAWCKHVCKNLGIVVVDIDYRLAPEFKFPVPIYDCWTAVKFMLSNGEKYGIDPQSVSIGGLSAGGHMTAVMAHFARDEKIDLKLQLMIVPSVDLRWEIAAEPLKSDVTARYPSVTLFADNPWSPRGRMKWFMDHWIGTSPERRDEVTSDWVASPILAPSFEGLATAHFVTAEFDLSRDETDRYADILRKNNVPTTSKRYLGVPHAFGHYNHPTKGLSQSRQYILDTCEVLKKAHGL
ncbi:related to esterase/lipase [Cephalotrichum gorgonifer]|uniref:Related to esterase/lipase n=1 Tax=Cephalotrichum gorgonifer TaxID=2041049 RepID=A0AAE8MS77_9PEZI|nr:related to esterase/lipase [Cephalotrichum gorgonifer]